MHKQQKLELETILKTLLKDNPTQYNLLSIS